MFGLKFFWQQLLSVDVSENIPPGEKNKIYITRGTGLVLVVLGSIFTLLNFLQGNFQLALVNITSTALGLICLLLVRQKIIQPAAILLIVGGGIIFFFSGLIFRNGMEYTLLLGMLGAVLMFGALWARILLAAANGAGFLLVKTLEFAPSISGQLPQNRYLINLLVFLLGYYLILEIFRTINGNYQRAIEKKNADLTRSRRQLDQEHTELMARTKELQVANQTKEKLFSIVAHDLRGPIGNLKTYLHLLDNRDLSTDDFQDLATDLKVSVDLAYECIDNLLLWSARQLHAIKPIYTEVALKTIAHDCVALLAGTATRKGISVHNTIPALARVWVDETQLASIFRNLLSNALKFTLGGGSVKISAIEEDGFWRVTVADTGIGMSQEKILLLFEPDSANSTFGTENEKGFGLGLQICQEFIQSNRGTFTIESREGHGSSFHFTLPSTDKLTHQPKSKSDIESF